MTRPHRSRPRRPFRHRRRSERGFRQARLADRPDPRRRSSRCSRRVFDRFAQPRRLAHLFAGCGHVGRIAPQVVRRIQDSAGNLSPVGGTSVGSPAFAGIVAILNQATQSGGLGNINPTLYSLGGRTRRVPRHHHRQQYCALHLWHADRRYRVARCPTSAPFQIGYSAAAGYDLVTGLGSVNANVLATAWPGFVLTPNFSVGGTPVSIASPDRAGLRPSPSPQPTVLSARVDLACALTPPSTTAGVTCSIPASVSVNGSSQTASLTISTTAPHVLSGATSCQGPHGLGWLAASSSALFAGIFFLGVPSRRRRI